MASDKSPAPGGLIGAGRKWCHGCMVRKGPNDRSLCVQCVKRLRRKKKGR